MEKQLRSYGIITVGSVIFALSFDWFFAANAVGMGGITGLAQVLNVLFPALSVGIGTILLNVPLFLAGWKFIGFHLLASSLFSMTVSSLAMDGIALLYTFSPMDPMLASICGGAMMGAGLALGLLTGCASLLERSYTTSEPHSSKFWESEAAATLRAENRQDMVNDLLILIGQHTETASLRLYNFPDEQTALEELEKAAQEVQQETPLGAYAVEYITYISQPQRSCFEADLQIGYRRTAEQMQTIVSASSVSALGDLLEAALDGGRTELVVRMGYWQADSREKVAQEVQQVRQERGTREEAVWIVHYYPETDPVGIIEFLLKPTEEEIQAYQAEQAAAAQSDAPTESEASSTEQAP